MLDLTLVIGSALAFAIYLRIRYYVLLADGLTLAFVLFLLYLALAAL